MAGRRWQVVLPALGGLVFAHGAELPPAELLDQLAFFESMHLLEDLEPAKTKDSSPASPKAEVASEKGGQS